MTMDFSVRCSPLKTIVSRKVISLFHVPAVDLIFGMGFISFFIKGWAFSVTVPKKGNVINETFLLVFLCWIRFVSVSALWIFAKDTAVFMPNATPRVVSIALKYVFCH